MQNSQSKKGERKKHNVLAMQQQRKWINYINKILLDHVTCQLFFLLFFLLILYFFLLVTGTFY
jgi:hypothetical protein